MKLISFDIGIKNMAYCIFDSSGSQTIIQNWNVINLMEEEIQKKMCDCMLEPKTKKTPAKKCNKAAKFIKNENHYCEKHAKKTTEFIIPSKACSQSSLKKLSIEELTKICEERKMIESTTTTMNNRITKKYLLEELDRFFTAKCFTEIINKKKKTANDTDLIMIGKNMKKLLNEIEDLQGITHVIIENQISPIANRMKTIQGMLSQYFIMVNENIHIEFISSANKLRLPSTNNNNNSENILRDVSINTSDRELITENQNAKYKMHKKDGVTICSQILNKNEGFEKWKYVLETKKKDDLADCFLQGIWYLQKKEILFVNL